MARNVTIEVTEKHRAAREEMAKMPKAGSFCRLGLPLSSDLTPPGTVVEQGNATVAISPATTKHDCEVLVSHAPPSLAIVPCVSSNISTEVLASRLYLGKKRGGMEFFTNCNLM